MPKTKRTNIASLPVVDIAYAVESLVAGGKTTKVEVLRLAAERGERIAAVEAELKALRGSGAPAAPTARAKTAAASRKAAQRKRAAAAKARPTKPAAAPVQPHLSPKLRKFRRVQGQYAGYLRGFAGAARERIRTINAEKGPAAALAEMKKLLVGKGGSKAAKAAPAKMVKSASARKTPPPTKSASKKLRESPQRKAQRKLQGTYIGMLRSRSEAEKAKLKALAKEKGFEAAIEVMRSEARATRRGVAI